MNEERKKIVERLVKQTNDWFKNNIKIIESKSNSSLDSHGNNYFPIALKKIIHTK